jgi:hypothetical protein
VNFRCRQCYETIECLLGAVDPCAEVRRVLRIVDRARKFECAVRRTHQRWIARYELNLSEGSLRYPSKPVRLDAGS